MKLAQVAMLSNSLFIKGDGLACKCAPPLSSLVPSLHFNTPLLGIHALIWKWDTVHSHLKGREQLITFTESLLAHMKHSTYKHNRYDCTSL